jgi:alkylation response protein AidB-like acyl-CoA dehydrogenase
MSLRSSVMGLGLKALNRLASLPGMDQPARRRKVAALLGGASRAGFAAALVMNRPFKAARQLLKPLRPAKAPVHDLLDLTPTDEQQMIVDAMQRFAGDVLRPAAAAADEAGAAPAALLAQAGALGITAMNVPDELGGVGQERSVITNALVAEALAHGDFGLAVACLSGPSVAIALAEFGSAEQEAQYLPSLTGDKAPQAAIAVMEGGALFNPFRLKTRATRKGGGWVLEGEKQLVSMAQQAELFLVAACDDEDRPALFIVESGSAGLAARPQPAMGLRAAGLSRLLLKNVKLPAHAKLGGEAGADYGQFIALSRLAWSALAVGTTQAVLDYVIPYANEREAFGEPISHKQSVAFMIANIGIELEGMRLATWRAAALAAHGKPFAREAALARSLCGRYGMRAGSDGVQVLGGHGFVKEHPVERWYRDLRAVAIMEGGVIL